MFDSAGEQNGPLLNVFLACKLFQAESMNEQKAQEEALTFLLKNADRDRLQEENITLDNLVWTRCVDREESSKVC